MQKAKRSLSAFLALAMLLSVMVFPANAVDSGCELAILSVQKMEGAFSPETAPAVTEDTSMSEGDIVVLTIGFRNTSGETVNVDGFTATLLYDKAKVTPYKGTAPFLTTAYQINTDFLLYYGWSQAGNDKSDDFVSAASSGAAAYAVANGAELVLARMAFQVNQDVGDATAVFRFDANTATEIRNAVTQTGVRLDLQDLRPFRLKIGEGGSDTEDPDNPDNPVVTDQQLYISKAQSWDTSQAFNPETAKDITSAKPNDVVVLTVSAKNNKTDENLDISAFLATIGYDKTKVTPYKGTAPFAAFAYQISTDLLISYGWSQAGNDKSDDFVSASSGGAAAYSIPAEGEVALVRMAFRVNADAADGLAEFRFVPDADDAPRNSLSDSSSKAFDLGTLQSFNLIIGDAAPTVSPKAASLEVPSSGTATQEFTAKDQAGNVMKTDVTWTIANPDNVPGVSINQNTGTVTVTSAASVIDADKNFTVTASANGKSDTATLTLKAKAPAIQITLTDDDTDKPASTVKPGEDNFTAQVKDSEGNVLSATWSVYKVGANNTRTEVTDDSVKVDPETGKVTIAETAEPGNYALVAAVGDETAEIPLTVQGEETELTITPSTQTIDVPATGNPAPLTFEVKDGETKVDNATLTWSMTPETVPGVTLSAGTLTVVGADFTGTSIVTVTATSTDEKSVSATITITKADAPASPVLSEVRLSSNTSVLEGANANPATITATAVGTPTGTLENISWTVTPPTGASPNGVTLNSADEPSVTLTVSPDADEGTYTITATQNAGTPNEKTASQTLTVSRRTIAGMIVKASQPSIEIPGIKDANRTANFTASVGNEVIRSSSLRWSVNDESGNDWSNTSGIQFLSNDDGSYTLTVTPDATADIQDTDHTSGVTGKTFTVTATYNGNSASASIVVRRADPVLSIVTLSFNDLSASTGDNPLSVVLDGSNATETVTATAKDQYGEPFKPVSGATNNISWALSSGGNGLGQNISGNGVGFRDPSSGESKLVLQTGNTASVIISRSAQHGTYIVEAAYDVDGTPRGATASMTITRSEAEQAATLTLSGGLLEMTVPGKNAGDNVLASESAFVAEVKNQYNFPMPDAPVNWKITDSFGREYPGVIDIPNNDGIVRVAYAAKDVIPANTRPVFTVTATSGNATQSRNIYIVRSAPYLDDILIEGQNSFIKNVQGTEDTVTVVCTALDQYETEFTGSVVWYLRPTGNGVSINSTSGLITIEKSAIPGAYNVAAAQGDNPSVGPKTLTVTRGTPVPTRVEISGGQPTIWIPGDGQEPATTNYRATVLDQFGSEMSGQTVTWSIYDDTGASVPGITIENGVVSVANEVKALITSFNYADFKTMYIKAECPAGNPVPQAEARIIVGRDLPVLSKVQLNGMDSPDSSGQQVTFE